MSCNEIESKLDKLIELISAQKKSFNDEIVELIKLYSIICCSEADINDIKALEEIQVNLVNVSEILDGICDDHVEHIIACIHRDIKARKCS